MPCNTSKLATIVEGNPKAPFSIATTPRCRGGRYSFPGLLYFTLDPYLIMLSVKQGGIKFRFLSLWYDSTWDWTQVSRAIGEHSNRQANVRYDVTLKTLLNLFGHLHTVKEFQVLSCNITYSIFARLNSFKHSYIVLIFLFSIDLYLKIVKLNC